MLNTPTDDGLLKVTTYTGTDTMVENFIVLNLLHVSMKLALIMYF